MCGRALTAHVGRPTASKGHPGSEHPNAFASAAVNLEELDSVIGDVERTERSLERLTDDLEKQMSTLHDVWEGLAAQAHTEAHQQWNDGMKAMRQAMAGLREAGRTAHGNHTSAGESNLQMWSDLG